jgi:hypothetical protein
MTQPSSGRSIALIAGALIALVVLEHALAGSVEAACSHGSLSKTQREVVDVFHRLEVLSMDLITHQPIPEYPSRRPCSGPSCSDGGSSGRNVPIPPSLDTNDRWLVALVCLDITAPDGSPGLSRGPSPSPVKRTVALERPPRSLSIRERVQSPFPAS